MAARLFLTLVAGLALGSCRASNSRDLDAEVDAAADRLWFAADGTGGSCDPPAVACTGFKDDKDFVDLCVAKGYQARTCGCALRCSGQLDYTPKAPAADASGTPLGRCSPSMAKEAEALLKDRTPGGPLDRCLGSHLCSGVLGSCADDELKASVRLRELSRDGCEEEVAVTVCRDGFVESLHCAEADVALLSKTWSEFRSKDVAVKRCMRKVMCSDDKSGCSGGDLREARVIKAAVDRDGCEYWLRRFCSLGGNAW